MNWQGTETVALRDLIGANRADLQTGPFGTQLHASSYVRNGVPVVAVKNIGDNTLVTIDIPMISDEDALRLSRHRLQANDILFSRKGAVERRALIRASEQGWIQGSDCIRLRFDDSIDARYVSYFLGSMQARQWLKQHAHGATMPSLNQQILGLLQIPLPPLPKQRAIAHVLGTLDDKIELNRKMNQTLEEIARALFRSWFVDFDPVRAKAAGRQPAGMDAATAALFPREFEEAERGEIPKGWSWSTIGSEFGVTMGQSPPGSTYNEVGDGLPFYQGRSDFGFRFPSLRVFCTSPTRVARKGDALISVRAPVGDLNIASSDCALGRGVASLRHKSGSSSLTFYMLQQLANLLDGFNAEGTVFGSINQRDLKSIRVLAPPEQLLCAFVDFAEPVDALIESNERETMTLIKLRDTLLPKLLSGEVRVPEGENILASAAGS